MYCTVHSGLPWQPWIGFFAGITPPESLHIIGKVEGKGASEQFKERGETHEPKSTTTTVIQNSSQFLFSYALEC